MASLLHRLGALRSVPRSVNISSAPAPRPVLWSELVASSTESGSRVVRFINCMLYSPDGTFVREDLWVRDGRIIDPVRISLFSSEARTNAFVSHRTLPYLLQLPFRHSDSGRLLPSLTLRAM